MYYAYFAFFLFFLIQVECVTSSITVVTYIQQPHEIHYLHPFIDHYKKQGASKFILFTNITHPRLTVAKVIFAKNKDDVQVIYWDEQKLPMGVHRLDESEPVISSVKSWALFVKSNEFLIGREILSFVLLKASNKNFSCISFEAKEKYAVNEKNEYFTYDDLIDFQLFDSFHSPPKPTQIRLALNFG